MQVPLLDLQRQYNSIKDDIDRAIQRVVDSQYFILGEEVENFESEIANYCGVKRAVGVASGTDALKLSLEAAGVGNGENDKVITTPFTYFATAGSIVNTGAEPVFVDIKPDTFNLDPTKLKDLLDSNPSLQADAKAIIPVHLYGQMADMDPIMELADEYDLAVVEDAAQAIGAEYKGEKAGSIGDAGCFSFFPTKNLGGYGDGGMVVTDDDELAEKVRMLRVHGAKEKYYNEMVGYNSRLDAIQAAVLLAKLPYLDEWSNARRKNASKYNEMLNPISGIKAPEVAESRDHIYHQYTIRVTEGNRDELKQYLDEQGIGTKIYYPLSLHRQVCFEDLSYDKGAFTVSEEAAEEVLSLPIFPELRENEIGYVLEHIYDFAHS